MPREHQRPPPAPDPAPPPHHLEPGLFFGRNRRSRSIAGLILSDTVYAPGLRVPRHVHTLPYFCWLVGGGYWERYGSQRVDFAPGSIVYHPAGELHFGDISPRGARCFHVELQPEQVRRLAAYGELPATHVEQTGGELGWLGARLFRELASDDPATPLAVEALTLEMLAALLRERAGEGRRAPSWLVRADERLHDELATPHTVTSIAAELGVSPLRLARAFRARFGEGLGERLRRLRVAEATRRLGRPGASLAELAAELGFADQSHFTRVFRAATGMTPGAYRRLLSS